MTKNAQNCTNNITFMIKINDKINDSERFVSELCSTLFSRDASLL